MKDETQKSSWGWEWLTAWGWMGIRMSVKHMKLLLKYLTSRLGIINNDGHFIKSERNNKEEKTVFGFTWYSSMISTSYSQVVGEWAWTVRTINIPVFQSAQDAVIKKRKLECVQTTDTPHRHEEYTLHDQGAGRSVSLRNYFLVHGCYLVMLSSMV